MMGWTRDLGRAVRSLRKRPGFSMVALVTVAVGVGSASAVFSLANWLILRPIPGVDDMEGLFASTVSHRDGDGRMTVVSVPTVREMQRVAGDAATIAAHQYVEVDFGPPGGDPLRVSGAAVTRGYFSLLGVTPQLGRLFLDEEFADPNPVRRVVVSDIFWRTHLGAAPRVVGQSVELNGFAFEIVGVAGRDFRGLERISETDFWIMPTAYLLLQRHSVVDVGDPGRRVFSEFIGRRTGSLPLSSLDDRFSNVLARTSEAFPDAAGELVEYRVASRAEVGLSGYTYDQSLKTLRLLGGGAGLLLLLACANLANLLLGQDQRRRAETAVRRALGASRLRVVRERMAEPLVLAVAGGALGIVLANAGLWLLRGARLWDLPELGAPTLDIRVVSFGCALACASAVLSGVVPAVLASREQPMYPMATASGRISAAGIRARGLLTTVQITASFVLLMGAILLVRTVSELRAVPLGYEPDGVSYHFIDPSAQGWSPEESLNLARALADDLGGVAGVEAVGTSSRPPLTWGRMVTRAAMPEDETDQRNVSLTWVDGDYFGAMGIELLAGRTFLPEELDVPLGSEPPAVLVSRTLANDLYGTTDVVGRTIPLMGNGGYKDRVILGVVEDVRVARVRGEPWPVVFAPRATSFFLRFTLLVRSDLPSADVEAFVRTRLAERGPGLSVREAGPLRAVVEDVFAEDRLVGGLSSIIALVAVLLAAVGLAGTLFIGVTERFREIGVRVALGAAKADIVVTVVRPTVVTVGLGLLLGAGAASLLTGVLEERLVGVSATSPGAYLLPVLVFMPVALVATWIPLRVATEVDPVEVLKSE